MVIVFAPTLNAIAPLAVPEVTLTLFTFTVALAWATVGVTVTDVVPLETVEV